MIKNSKFVFLVCGAISIIATILLYFLTFDSILTFPMRWISLIFLVFSECIGTIKALNVKKSIFGVANITSSVLHLIAVLIISVIFVNFFLYKIKEYILLNVLLLCVLAVVDVTVGYFGEYTKNNNKITQSEVNKNE